MQNMNEIFSSGTTGVVPYWKAGQGFFWPGHAPYSPRSCIQEWTTLSMEALKTRKLHSPWVCMVHQYLQIVQSHGRTRTALRALLHKVNWSCIFVPPLQRAAVFFIIVLIAVKCDLSMLTKVGHTTLCFCALISTKKICIHLHKVCIFCPLPCWPEY